MEFAPRRDSEPFVVFLYGVLIFTANFVNSALASYQTVPWRLEAMFDLGGTIHTITDPEEQKRIYEEVPPRVRGIGSLQNLPGAYNPRNWESLARPTDPVFQPQPWEYQTIQEKNTDLSTEDIRNLMKIWITTVIRHPFAWLYHRLQVFKEVLGATRHDLHEPVFMDPNEFPDWVARAYGSHNPDLNGFQRSIKSFLSRASLHIFFRPWVYFLLSLVTMIVCLVFFTFERFQIGLIAASAFVHEIGLFLCAPTDEFRYSHYMVYASVLAVLLLLSNVFPNRQNSETNSRPLQH
jgi:hypothetical protein